MARVGPFRVETVRGTPATVYDRTLLPLSRIISCGRHRATIRTASIQGSGRGVALVQPLAVIETHDGIDRLLPVPDITQRVLAQMTVVAFVVPVIALALVAANRLARNN